MFRALLVWDVTTGFARRVYSLTSAFGYVKIRPSRVVSVP